MKTPTAFLSELEQRALECALQHNGPQTAKQILRKHEAGGITLPGLKPHYKATTVKTAWLLPRLWVVGPGIGGWPGASFLPRGHTIEPVPASVQVTASGLPRDRYKSHHPSEGWSGASTPSPVTRSPGQSMSLASSAPRRGHRLLLACLSWEVWRGRRVPLPSAPLPQPPRWGCGKGLWPGVWHPGLWSRFPLG